MKYYKTTEGNCGVWLQNANTLWVVTIYQAINQSTIKCEAGPEAARWGKLSIGQELEPCTEAEFTEIYNRAIEHQRKYRKEATV